jgi:hypothetical protein
MITNFVQKQNSQLLFNRAYSFTLGKMDDTGAIQFQNYPSKDSKGQMIPSSPLRIIFDIEKNMVGSPNKTKFDIYNLSLETRSQIKAGHVLELKAGYNGLMDRLFFGQIGLSAVKSVRNGPDIVTSMECMDGAGAIIMARINKSYPPGIRLYQILEDILAEMSTETEYNPVPIDTGMMVNIPDVVFSRGKTLSGTCKDALNELLKDQGIRWSVQNNSLIILPLGKTTNKSAIEISPTTGMIGVPTKNDGFIEVRALLNPQIQPGTLIKLVTQESAYNLNSGKNDPLSGFYEVRVAKYKGDTYGNDWSVTCQCWAIEASELQSVNSISSGFNLKPSVISRLA